MSIQAQGEVIFGSLEAVNPGDRGGAYMSIHAQGEVTFGLLGAVNPRGRVGPI